ncbi:hypothetical protein Golax_010731, partial [Gossypium laxum]|nr:hypothetical protein [Gossypium laxum]
MEETCAGVVKIIVDAAIDAERMGLGVIVKNDDGFVLGGFGCVKETTINRQRANDIYLQLKTFEAAVI